MNENATPPAPTNPATSMSEQWLERIHQRINDSKESVYILASDLQETWCSHKAAIATLTNVAKRGRVEIRILVDNESHLRSQHYSLPITELMHQFSDTIKLRMLAQEHKDEYAPLVIADQRYGSYLKPFSFITDSIWIEPLRAKEISKWFREAWEFGQTNPNLRQLSI